MTAELAALDRALARTRLRMRAQRGLAFGLWCMTVLAAALALLEVAWRLRGSKGLPVEELLALLIVSALATLAGLLLRVPSARAADALDRAGALEGRVRTALAFRTEPVRTPFMEAAMRDAARRLASTSPALAAPWRTPRATYPALAALTLYGASLLWPASAPPRTDDGTPPAGRLHPDDLRVAEEAITRIEGTSGLSPAVRDVLSESRTLISQLSEEHAQARQALAALADALGRELDDARKAEALARTLDEALAEGAAKRADSAADAAFRRVIDVLARRSESLRAAQLDAGDRAALTSALTRARALAQERLAARRERGSQDGEPRLLEPPGEASEASPSAAQETRSGRTLERLRHALEASSEALTGADDARTAEALDQARDALSQLAEARRDFAARQALAREIARLRSLLDGSSARPEHDPAPEPTATAPTQRALRTDRDHAERDDAGAGWAVATPAPVGSDAGKPAEPARAELRMALPAPSEVHAETRSAPGFEHDETRAGEPSQAHAPLDSQPLPAAHGSGPTRSDVIAGAARGGFASAPYRKVYADYRAHAEQLISRDEVPAGHREYVRRYFALIAPRAAEEAPP